MNIIDRIQKLDAKIQRIKEEKADKMKAKYQYLVGHASTRRIHHTKRLQR